MSESPTGKPFMTIAPDGYAPSRIQLQKVKGSRPSLVQPEVVEEIETPTAKSSNFLKKVVVASSVGNVGFFALNGSQMVEAISDGQTGRALFAAATTGFSLIGVGIGAILLRR